jgi:hypothetical protein
LFDVIGIRQLILRLGDKPSITNDDKVATIDRDGMTEALLLEDQNRIWIGGNKTKELIV